MVAFTTNSTVAMANLLGTFPRRAPRGARILPLTGLGRHAKRYRLNQGAIHGRFGSDACGLVAGSGRGGIVSEGVLCRHLETSTTVIAIMRVDAGRAALN